MTYCYIVPGTPATGAGGEMLCHSPQIVAARLRKGTNRVSTDGVAASFMFFVGTFWAFPLTYFYLHKSARAYLFPRSFKTHNFCSDPISVDPIRPQPNIVSQTQPWDMCQRPTRRALTSSLSKFITVVAISCR